MAWTDTVEAHPLWPALADAKAVLGEDGWPDDADLRDALVRTKHALDQAEQRKDPASLTTESLNNANSAVSNLRNSLANAKDNPAGYVPAIHQNVDQLLTFIAAWPAPDRLRLTQGIREATDQVQTSAEAVIADLKRQLDSERAQAEQNLADWKAAADEQLTALTTKNDELTAKVAEATSELATQRQRLDTALNENAATFQAAEKDRAVAAQEASKRARTETDHLLAKIKESGESNTVEMDGLLDQAKTTLDTIGVTATASHYDTYAKDQKDIADRWRRGAVGALIASGLVFVAAFLGSLFTQLSWRDTILELAVGSAVAGVSGYAGSQSAGHRRQERKAQRFALGLKAMTSYLATADTDRVDDLKIQLASQLFIEDGESDSTGQALPPTAAALAPMIEAAVKAAVQKNQS